MKSKIIILFVFTVLSAVFCEDILVVTDEWLDCTNSDGTGLYFDILREVYTPEDGYKLEYQIVPYSRSVYMVEKNNADIVIGPYEKDEISVLFPKYHMFVDDASSVFLTENLKNWKGEESLKGKTLVWMRGYGYEKYLTVKFKKFHEVDKISQALGILKAGRVDYFIGPSIDIEESGEFDDQLFATQFIKWIKMFYCFSESDKGRRLMEFYDKRFEELLKLGKIKELFIKWNLEEYYKY